MATFVPYESNTHANAGIYYFIFNIINQSQQPLPYNLTGLPNTSQDMHGGYGTVGPGQTSQVAFNYGDRTIQCSSVPLITVAGQQVNFYFWSGYSGSREEQYINILPDNGFQITEDTSIQNNAAGYGFTIGLGGNGDDLTTSNICIIVSD